MPRQKGKLTAAARLVYDLEKDQILITFSCQPVVKYVNFSRKGIIFLYDKEGKLAGLQVLNARKNGFCQENIFINLDEAARIKHIDHIWLRRQAARREVTTIKAGRERLTTLRWVKNLAKRKKVKTA